MRRRAVVPSAVLVSAALLGLTAAGPAAMATASAEAGPGLLLSVSGPGADGARSVTLVCDPPGGTHPQPVAACAALTAAGGDPNALAGEPGLCTTLWSPVTASAYGEFRGEVVTWRKTFANACVLHRDTTPVFDF
ncbi:peptidase [Streptomyces clavuligerus]|nr:peptidase [Streptomyces clavuligerus]